MKKVIFLLIIANISIFAQNFQPAQRKVNYLGNNIYLNTHTDFKQNKFTLGWHWHHGKRMSEALSVNQPHLATHLPDNGPGTIINPNTNIKIANNSNMILYAPFLCSNIWWAEGWNKSVSDNIGVRYEPTYRVNIDDPYNTFIPRQYDTTRYAFGFANVKGEIPTNRYDPNYDRLILRKNNANVVNQIVLSEPWKSNILRSKMEGKFVNYYQYIYRYGRLFAKVLTIDSISTNIPNKRTKHVYDSSSDTIVNGRKNYLLDKEWKGVEFYFGINLRRIDASDNDINSNDTVLTIEMPYTTQEHYYKPNSSVFFIINNFDEAGKIRFDSLPSPINYNYTTFANCGNSKVRNMIEGNSRVLAITKRMLPAGNDPNKDITIYAHFRCDPNPEPDYVNKANNLALCGYPRGEFYKQIDSLKISVKYHGKSDVAIDWIDITTRPTRELSLGVYDSLIASTVQNVINFTTTPAFRSRNIKPYRFYCQDECNEPYWYAFSYMNKLMGNIFTYEGMGGTKQFAYYCNPTNIWNGSGGFLSWRTNPYIPHLAAVDGYVEHMHKNYGNSHACKYDHAENSSERFRLLAKSHYETKMNDGRNLFIEAISPRE